jgi:molybdate transport system substrate-binding protein
MSTLLLGISSMATRLVLADLSVAFEAETGQRVQFESVGGVDAQRRVADGEKFDVVVLASNAIDKLIAGGHVRAGSRVDVVRSGVSVAVPAGATQPDLTHEDAVRAAVLAAPTLGCSTGPSGTALLKLFEIWGIADRVSERIVTPPPGTPVGELIARGEIALGFQQLSELIHVPGITIVGPLPDDIQINTIFSAGICSTCEQGDVARRFLDFLHSPAAAAAKRLQGMGPA